MKTRVSLKYFVSYCRSAPGIANSGNAAVTRISESKLDESVLQLSIQINNYDLFCQDRNKNCGGAACYIKGERSYIQNQYIPDEIQNIFFKILLPKTKPIADIYYLQIAYPKSSYLRIAFLGILNKNFPSIDKDAKET